MFRELLELGMRKTARPYCVEVACQGDAKGAEAEICAAVHWVDDTGACRSREVEYTVNRRKSASHVYSSVLNVLIKRAEIEPTPEEADAIEGTIRRALVENLAI